MENSFESMIKEAYQFTDPSVLLGTAILEGEPLPNLQILAPLKMMNRHGLIAGATGTGKTKTIQILVEQLSRQGVPCVVMDFKGDLSGLAEPGVRNAAIEERMKVIGESYQSCAYPVEFFTLSQSCGVKIRCTLMEFGPLLFSRLLMLNDNQSGLVAVIFKYSLDNALPLIDLSDFKALLTLFESDERLALEKNYGKISTTSVATIRRKIIALEEQGVVDFFGEPSLDIDDLLQCDDQNFGKISLIKLGDIQDKSYLISTFMLSLLTEIYNTFPEVGDLEKPKLILFIDEAHLLFENANQVLLDKIENIVKLIRSKGVGLFFCTQSPDDIPSSILGQLGLKVQHAIRAFTAKDRKALKLAAENYPDSKYYETTTLLTSLGIGEAAITTLDLKGRPTPLVASLLPAPQSSMSAMSEQNIKAYNEKSILVKKYETTLDRVSAAEKLNAKIEKNEHMTVDKVQHEANTMITELSKNTLFRQIVTTIFREVIRVITKNR